MTDVPFTAAQIAMLRAALGVPDGSPDPTAADLLVVLTAEGIAAAEDSRWHGLGP